MPIFKRREKTKETSSEKKDEKYNSKEKNIPEKIKKKKIGIRHKDKKLSKKVISNEKEERKPTESKPSQIINEPTQLERSDKKIKDIDIFPDETTANKEEKTRRDVRPKESKEKEWTSSKKRKTFVPRDIRGKSVYLEDTGEKLGIVFDIIFDRQKNPVGYKIKDNRSDAVMSFPIDQFDEDKNGLIFVPSWYIKALQTLEKLEFKERVSPELTALITDDALSNEELYNIFVRHDDQMAKYIEEAIALKEMTHQRLKALEKQRLALKDNLMDLTEKRLIKDIDRRAFSEDVIKHRRKVNILDVNIKKCKGLLQRLDHTSFGILSKNIISETEKKTLKKQDDQKSFVDFVEKDKIVYDQKIESPYKDKYYDLKGHYTELQGQYNNLKIAVENIENEIEDPYEDKYYDLKGRYDELQDEHKQLKMAVEKLLTKSEI